MKKEDMKKPKADTKKATADVGKKTGNTKNADKLKAEAKKMADVRK